MGSRKDDRMRRQDDAASAVGAISEDIRTKS